MLQRNQNITELRMKVRRNTTRKLKEKVKLKRSILTSIFSPHLLIEQIQGVTPLLDIPYTSNHKFSTALNKFNFTLSVMTREDRGVRASKWRYTLFSTSVCRVNSNETNSQFMAQLQCCGQETAHKARSKHTYNRRDAWCSLKANNIDTTLANTNWQFALVVLTLSKFLTPH